MTKEEATALALERLGADEVAKRSEGVGLYIANRDAFVAYNLARADKIRAFAKDLDDNDPEIAALKQAYDAAEAAWMDFEGVRGDVLQEGEADELATCAVSGVALFNHDALLHDHATGAYILRAALPLPPLRILPEFEEDEPEDTAPAVTEEATA